MRKVKMKRPSPRKSQYPPIFPGSVIPSRSRLIRLRQYRKFEYLSLDYCQIYQELATYQKFTTSMLRGCEFLHNSLLSRALSPARYTPIPEAEYYESVLTHIYEQPLADQDPLDSHRLAILFLVLATGSLLDLDSPALSDESMQYYHLGRASLSLDSVLEFQSIPALQALVRDILSSRLMVSDFIHHIVTHVPLYVSLLY